ncbi:alpha/beta hydrolase family protein [Hydrogenophaga pseudoflava]|uniref:alpha/beta hydrolase family protein n=1 Tax=Hydrogenophaga pseudoflava TaxID=47421 RepID=UPI0027E47AE0|nr:alpha/beta fold hydrolase [Hydrogenophaga pseudoflava]MDQ7744710.1 alpha/beta fold hydrolase [Hydrogenophaga pseudoflava]
MNIPHQPTDETVSITCADGQRLRGHFIARSGGAPGGLPVLISPATGVRQHFYLRFARWLAAQGHDVLVFDYRGIGLSLQGRLKDCRATLADWGQQDQVAALDWLLARTGAAQAVIVGHSAGGQMIGLLPNHHRVARLVGISASTGWFKAMRPGFRLKANFGMRLVLPLGTRLTGYGTTALLGLGENLPAGVALQWSRWCARGGYATNAVRHQPERDFHAQVRTPVTVLHAEDDDIANPATVADLLRTLPAAPRQAHCLKPRDLGLRHLGHLDWFRQSHQSVWPLMARAVRGEAVRSAPGH